MLRHKILFGCLFVSIGIGEVSCDRTAYALTEPSVLRHREAGIVVCHYKHTKIHEISCFKKTRTTNLNAVVLARHQ